MHPKFQGPKYRLLRALMFVATGLSGTAPLIHGLNALLEAQTYFWLYRVAYELTLNFLVVSYLEM